MIINTYLYDEFVEHLCVNTILPKPVTIGSCTVDKTRRTAHQHQPAHALQLQQNEPHGNQTTERPTAYINLDRQHLQQTFDDSMKIHQLDRSTKTHTEQIHHIQTNIIRQPLHQRLPNTTIHAPTVNQHQRPLSTGTMHLFIQGLLVLAIRPSIVLQGIVRLRIFLLAAYDFADVQCLIDVLVVVEKIWTVT